MCTRWCCVCFVVALLVLQRWSLAVRVLSPRGVAADKKKLASKKDGKASAQKPKQALRQLREFTVERPLEDQYCSLPSRASSSPLSQMNPACPPPRRWSFSLAFCVCPGLVGHWAG